jgi:hypothetical protein
VEEELESRVIGVSLCVCVRARARV